MSLGSIAHLQYYFARTGLLDGKGGQFAKKTPDFKRVGGMQRSSSMGAPSLSMDISLSPDESMYALSDSGVLLESPVDQNDEADWDRELALLPPTVSTYNVRPTYAPPPPDNAMLRRELTEALEDALKVVKESDKSTEGEKFLIEMLMKCGVLIARQMHKAGTKSKAFTSLISPHWPSAQQRIIIQHTANTNACIPSSRNARFAPNYIRSWSYLKEWQPATLLED
jgi:hypothetical protein